MASEPGSAKPKSTTKTAHRFVVTIVIGHFRFRVSSSSLVATYAVFVSYWLAVYLEVVMFSTLVWVFMTPRQVNA